MKCKIKCSTCNEEMGTIEKPVITEKDRQEYEQMISCSNEHTTIETVIIED